MKRLVVFALLLSAASAFAQTARPYIVGTRHPAIQGIRDVVDVDSSVARDAVPFRFINAFATDLTDEQAAALRKSPNVRYVEEDVMRYAISLAPAPMDPIVAKPVTSVRNLSGQTLPYGISMVDAPSVWPTVRGNDVNVAVLDTGIDYTHPDLQAAYVTGYNTFTKTNDPRDDNSHGTHVAGTIAATDNQIGVVGVAPSVHLFSVKVLDSSGSGRSSNTIAGIEWVLQQKADRGGNWIISLSLGACGKNSAEQEEFTKAINAGILVIAAAGNHDPTQPEVCTATDNNMYSVGYPAAYPGVVAVGAVDSNSNIADFSNFGPEVQVAAPGVDVLSTFPVGTGDLAYLSAGTATLDAAAITGSPYGTVTGHFVDCGLGNPADFPPGVAGNIALIKRGDLTFAQKAKNAQAAGASAVVVYNKDDSALNFTLIDANDPTTSTYPWPLALAISNADGLALLQQPSTTISIVRQKDDYELDSGTSMATPHVSGVAALVWSAAPSATAEAVRQAIISTAHDLGDPGVDVHYGYGLIDALAAAKNLAPTRFGSGGTPQAPPVVGRRFLRRRG